MLAVAAVRQQHHTQRSEGGGVREEGARVLRFRPGRSTHTHQDRLLRDLAEPRGAPHVEHVADVRRWNHRQQAATGNYV